MKNALNLIGWLGTGLVVAAVGIRLLRPDLDQYAVYGAWAGLGCVVLYTLGQYREIIDYFKQRNARYGAVASLSVVLFLGVMVAVNYLSTRQNRRWDLTKNQAFTLSDQTVKDVFQEQLAELAREATGSSTRVTRLALGLPMGGDLEYADEVTMSKALEGRREL